MVPLKGIGLVMKIAKTTPCTVDKSCCHNAFLKAQQPFHPSEHLTEFPFSGATGERGSETGPSPANQISMSAITGKWSE